MLGRVLSGTKYGVKQTRGKFGLGAKMALIWSKMSTGAPGRDPQRPKRTRPSSPTTSWTSTSISAPLLGKSPECPPFVAASTSGGETRRSEPRYL